MMHLILEYAPKEVSLDLCFSISRWLRLLISFFFFYETVSLTWVLSEVTNNNEICIIHSKSLLWFFHCDSLMSILKET